MKSKIEEMHINLTIHNDIGYNNMIKGSFGLFTSPLLGGRFVTARRPNYYV